MKILIYLMYLVILASIVGSIFGHNWVALAWQIISALWVFYTQRAERRAQSLENTIHKLMKSNKPEDIMRISI